MEAVLSFGSLALHLSSDEPMSDFVQQVQKELSELAPTLMQLYGNQPMVKRYLLLPAQIRYIHSDKTGGMFSLLN